MKDTLISGKRKKKELLTFLACFVLANIIHLFAILKYDNASMTELVTSIGYVTVFCNSTICGMDRYPAGSFFRM
ncbi:MAG: hypothetical protein LUE98_07965 [Tannerellaceae bacterium]|nr:hypothetical protein [Tannerellaceae bacterium]